jgi:small subunit ribosomal protein S9
VSDQPMTPESPTTPAPAAPIEPTPAPTETAAPAATIAATPSAAPAEQAAPAAPRTYFWGTGRRKTSVARVRIRPGSGKFVIQGRDMEKYFFDIRHRMDVIAPLKATNTFGRWDVFVNVSGGGPTGQAGAVLLGVARALMKADPTLEPKLRDGRYLTRDAREVERKKPGQPGARKRFQFSKR